MIEIEHLSKTYKRQAAAALQSISLSIGHGVFGLLGPNGAGKSTLMGVVATLIEPSQGHVLVAGHDVRHERAAIRRLLGFLPQDFGFYPHLTAYETLNYLALLTGLGRERHARIAEVLEIVNLTEVARKRVGTFSGGMKQRLGIAQALLNRPAVLIVDEPTAGLDPVERVRFHTLLGELGTHTTVVLSTHIVADVVSTCTEVAVLHKGCVLYHGSLAGLAAQAERQVWTATIAPESLSDVQRLCTVAAAMPARDGLEVRLIGIVPPSLAAVPVPPTLEDGYLALAGPAAQAARPLQGAVA